MKTGWKRICLLIALTMVFIAGCSKHEPPVIEVDPPERHELTYVGEVRYVLSDDGKTVLEKHVPYGNGDIGHQYFRQDGTLARTTEDYAPGADGKSQLKSKAVWSDDGKTFVEGEVYRPDGHLLSKGRTLPNGNDYSTLYLPNGTLLLSAEESADGKWYVTNIHRPDGTIIGKERSVRERESTPDVEYMEGYSQDGQTLLWRVDYLVAGDNRIKDFDPPKSRGQLITFFSSAGKVTHRQWWKFQWNPHTGKRVRLVFVEIYDQSGLLTETVFVEDTGPLLHLEEVRLADGTTKQFRQREAATEPVIVEKWKPGPNVAEKTRELKAGTLAKVLDAGGTVVAEHEADENIRELLEPSLFKRGHLQQFDEIEKLQARMAAEDLSYLGKRDDNNPCRWYLTP